MGTAALLHLHMLSQMHYLLATETIVSQFYDCQGQSAFNRGLQIYVTTRHEVRGESESAGYLHYECRFSTAPQFSKSRNYDNETVNIKGLVFRGSFQNLDGGRMASDAGLRVIVTFPLDRRQIPRGITMGGLLNVV